MKNISTFAAGCLGLVIAMSSAHAYQDCYFNDECDAGSYCVKPDGVCQSVGYCAIRPEKCSESYDPVCGCDQQIYSNACFAAAAGVNVQNQGDTCEETTACFSNAQCAEDEHCFFENCYLNTGVCRPREMKCLDTIVSICGCDGVTYSDICEPPDLGVSVDHFGECTESFCQTSDQCAEGERCVLTDFQRRRGYCKAVLY